MTSGGSPKGHMSDNKTVYVNTREDWRLWLQENHDSEDCVWLVYYKKHTRKRSIPYADAVEEAICFGWIDGQIRRIDDERYIQRFTPRRRGSIWSELNIERARKMIRQGRMTQSGLEAFREGMEMKKRVPSSRSYSVPAYLETALGEDKTAWDNFQALSPSAKLAYVHWIDSAKKDETRQKRIEKTLSQLTMKRRLGEE